MSKQEKGPGIYWYHLGRVGPYVPNNRVAVKPFVTLQPETKGKTFVTVKQKTSLYSSEVVFGNEDYDKGWTVYVRGDSNQTQWAKDKWEHEGVEFILIPASDILLVTKPEASKATTTVTGG